MAKNKYKISVQYLSEVLTKIYWKTWEMLDGNEAHALNDMEDDAEPIARDIGTTPEFVLLWIEMVRKEQGIYRYGQKKPKR
jgi:hypothetical protein